MSSCIHFIKLKSYITSYTYSVDNIQVRHKVLTSFGSIWQLKFNFGRWLNSIIIYAGGTIVYILQRRRQHHMLHDKEHKMQWIPSMAPSYAVYVLIPTSMLSSPIISLFVLIFIISSQVYRAFSGSLEHIQQCLFRSEIALTKQTLTLMHLSYISKEELGQSVN